MSGTTLHGNGFTSDMDNDGVNVGVELLHIEEQREVDDIPSGSIAAGDKSGDPVDGRSPNLRTEDTEISKEGATCTDMHVQIEGKVGGNSRDKSQPRRGLRGRRLKAPSFKRRKRQTEPGTPSDSDSSDTKERRRHNVTPLDWPAMKAKKAKLEIASSRKVEGDAPLAESESPSPKHLH